MTATRRCLTLFELIEALGYRCDRLRGSTPGDRIPLRARLQSVGSLFVSEEVFLKRFSLRCTDPQDHITLLFLLQGALTIETNRELPVIRHSLPHSGNVTVFFAQNHDFTVTHVPCRLLRVQLPLGSRLDGIPDDFQHGPVHWTADLSLLSTMLLLLEQSVGRGTSDQIRTELATTLFDYLWDRLSVLGVNVSLPAQRSVRHDDPLHRLDIWLGQHLNEPLNLSALASSVNLSPRRLQELCRHHYGVSPMQRLRTLRLAALAAQLVDPEFDHLSIAALLKSLQLSDNHLMRLSFKRLYGSTPSELRANRRPVISSQPTQVVL